MLYSNTGFTADFSLYVTVISFTDNQNHVLWQLLWRTWMFIMVLLNIALTDQMYVCNCIIMLCVICMTWNGVANMVFTKSPLFQIIGDTERARSTLQSAVEKDRVRLIPCNKKKSDTRQVCSKIISTASTVRLLIFLIMLIIIFSWNL